MPNLAMPEYMFMANTYIEITHHKLVYNFFKGYAYNLIFFAGKEGFSVIDFW